ncbi:MAG: 16S rRNA (cytosine1402-N4)-methyltransferase [Oceanicoccus sp.]|jgi:16S rRNA (cytosine1402-N4)-methyltransferase
MTVVDCNLGLGGHSSHILKAIGPTGMLYAFDLDERNITVARKRLSEIGDNFHIFHDSFASLTDRLRREGVPREINAVFFDLGLSSPHIDDPERGFSFLNDGPLDMRFDASSGPTAADLLQTTPEKELADIFYKYGEERASRKLAKAIVEDRKQHRFTRTLEFADYVERVLGRGKPGKHRATTIFQALRIAVNEELSALELGLNQAVEYLAPHGRVVVLSYHSLEDRIVKHFFKDKSTDLRDPNDPFGSRVLVSKTLSLLTKKPIKATPKEVAKNKRARSGLLRAAEKI